MKNRGFTILETLIVCAILGMIAAIAIPMYMNSQDRARQAKTLSNLRTIGAAWEARAAEVKSYNAAGATPTFTMPSGTATPAEVNQILSPTYVKEIPRTDGWGHDLEFYIDSVIGSSTPASTYAIRSPGRAGSADKKKKTGAKYTIGATTNFDCDIVYSNGQFIAFPQGKQDQ